MKKTKAPLVEKAQEIVTTLFELMGVSADIEVKEVKTKGSTEKTLEVQIDAQNEAGLLIGAHGSTLNAIQVFLGMALRQSLGEWVRIVVDIGDWKQKQEEYLHDLADQTAGRAKSTKEAQNLYNLTPSQRRVIHLKLSEDPEIETESLGEGDARYLVVKAK